MLAFYMDESTDKYLEKVFVVAGFLGDSETWFEAERHWEARVKIEGLDYFRATDCISLTGEFEKLVIKHGRDRAREISEELLVDLKRIVKSADLLACCLWGSMPDYRAVYSDPYGPFVFQKSPYVACHEEIIYQVAKNIYKHSPKEVVAFLFDESNQAATLQGRWSQFKTDHPEAAQCMGTLSPLDDRQSPAIQMADLIANTAKRAFETRMHDPNAGLAELKEWTPRLGFVAQWSEEYLKLLMDASIDMATTPKFSFERNG